jgi:general secretion pathway protein H
MRRAAPGFTLIEVLVVLAILGLSAGLVATRARPGAGGWELRGAGRGVGDLLREARATAIAGNRAVTVLAEASTGRLGIAGGRQLSLPRGVVLLAGAAIGFAGDSSSTGGTLVLAQGEQRLVVAVDWLTGRISLAAP